MSVSDIIEQIEMGGSASTGDVAELLSVRSEDDISRLFSAAASVRDRFFGKKVFMYGFVYFSTHCRNNCAFCYYRRTNDLPRYRKTKEEVLALSASLKDAGINLVDLTMGEDPFMCANDYEEFLDITRTIKDEIDISVMASPGAVPSGSFVKFKEAGTDWFACYQETYNRELFNKLRLEQNFDNRLSQKIWAREAGILAEDGIMVGLGESLKDRADSIIKMGSLGCEQIRAMTFVPQKGTPMEKMKPSRPIDELIAIAVMRLIYPDRLIPASLDVEGIAGLKSRLDAGANVITSIVPPHQDLAGVAQHELDIENGHRSVAHVMHLLDEMGKKAASNTEYESLLKKLKEQQPVVG
ncbi:3-methylornithine synthase [Candidatus Methanoplasma termitum]|uniref:PylB2 protein n=1 Tax=Candidatus Methanoplasma termitum TaxID=1577791 RepID=A0A0A7LBL3_9ARCH|nr:methylornithine synthase PylB [Candidatus Methanoplasma termitum]AIZ56459.1 3-methylornithine synthase [Candidatus Methanoplasma termitum]MCL2333559.1 methylornithine synthase PylB [Candidatus Methanoplasma sp.]